MSKLNWMTKASAAFLLWAMAAVALPAQTFTTLYSFDNTPDGSTPSAGLIQGTDGNLYGTAEDGGAPRDGGTIFQVTPSGTFKTLYTFCGKVTCPDGRFPATGLIQTSDGSLFGTTVIGGIATCDAPAGCGTVFTVTPSGALTTLHSFDLTDGYSPAALIQGADGNFYGTTSGGGNNQSCVNVYEKHGCGTIFKITPSGTLTTLYNFCGQGFPCPDGAIPFAGLIQGTDRSFYGTTGYGGAADSGTVFKVTAGGTLTTLYSFCLQKGCPDGEVPTAELLQATDGDFYGTTFYGGTRHNNGTIFKVTPSGALTTLYTFCTTYPSCPDGSGPDAPLIQATDGNFYGTAFSGGDKYYGTVFSITPIGTLTTLHTFSQSDGNNPAAALLQDTNGEFYGTSEGGGPESKSYGTIFSLFCRPGAVCETDAYERQSGSCR